MNKMTNKFSPEVRERAVRLEIGGEKVCHGSGGIVLLRAE